MCGPRTIALEVRELEPGHLLTVSAAGEVLAPRPYWATAQVVAPEPEPDSAEPASLVSRALHRAMKRHLISDAQIAVALSGGIDSALLACLAAQYCGRLRLVTVSFPERRYSESRYAAQVARRIGAQHEVTTLTADDLLGWMPDALRAMDQPSVDGINTFVTTRVAASLGIRVLLSGLGGDEVFGGYTTFTKLPLLLRCRPLLRALARVGLWTAPRVSAQWHKIRQAEAGCGLPELYLLQRSIRWRGMPGGLDASECPPAQPGLPAECRAALAQNHHRDAFHEIAFLEFAHYLRNQLLRDADVFSMANSVEVRVPYLDLDVVSQAMALPGSSHVRRFQGKQIPRRLLAAICPELPLGRRKMGFLFPWAEWLRGPLRHTLAETLYEKPLYEPAGLDFAAATRAFQAFLNGRSQISWYQIWSLFVLLNWVERNRRPC